MAENFIRQQIDVNKLPQQITEKWSPSVLTEGFVPFPKKLLRSMHTIFCGEGGAKELSVLLAIVDFKRPNLTRQPSSAYLAFLAGLEEQDFETVLTKLKEKGFVDISGDRESLNISISGFLDVIERTTK